MEIVIVGVGKFGSALSAVYKKQGLSVHHVHRATDDSEELMNLVSKSIVLLCVPTQKIPKVLEHRGDLLRRSRFIISTAKGLIQKTGETPRDFIVKRHRDFPSILVMSGPSFAAELKAGQPTALVLSGKEKSAVDKLAVSLSTTQLRIYKSYDPKGVELCGALKNVYAIGAGIAEGLGFGDSTRAALNTRALAEMSRIGRFLGGDLTTFFGLAGAGDLFLTCSSRQSRNFQFGLGLAHERSKGDLLRKLGTVEGLWTAAAAQKLCAKKKIRAPLLETIAAMIAGRLRAQEALQQLMSRKARHEFD